MINFTSAPTSSHSGRTTESVIKQDLRRTCIGTFQALACVLGSAYSGASQEFPNFSSTGEAGCRVTNIVLDGVMYELIVLPLPNLTCIAV